MYDVKQKYKDTFHQSMGNCNSVNKDVEVVYSCNNFLRVSGTDICRVGFHHKAEK